MTKHECLMQAQRIISNARYEVAKDEGTDSPAWSKLFRVGAYLSKQAQSNFDEIVGAA